MNATGSGWLAADSQLSSLGAALGLTAGLGGWLLISRAPWRHTPTLDQRLAPYLDNARTTGWSAEPRTTHRMPLEVLELLLGPLMSDAVRWVERVSGGAGTVRRRLDQLGGRRTVEQFRAEQVLCAVCGGLVGSALGALTVLGRGFSPIPVLGLVLIGTLVGVLGRDQYLSRQIRRREDRIMAEFPAVAELLALSVTAGEGALGALDRVAQTCQGDLSDELKRTLADARTGMSLIDALSGLATRTTLPSLARFVDGVAVAVERGTPLAEVLRAQAQDVREVSRRRLMEAGGRKEIAMMVPVVFLVLPITVLFAIYPGLAVLDLSR